jgi:hypothetical protein
MKKVINKTTGVEEVQFGGKLVSISDTALTNTNGKEYKVATIDFDAVDGSKKRCTALVYAGNYNHGLTVGETYLATATPTPQGVIVKLSHLTYNGDRATSEMFGFAGAVAETQPVAQMQPNTAFEEV